MEITCRMHLFLKSKLGCLWDAVYKSPDFISAATLCLYACLRKVCTSVCVFLLWCVHTLMCMKGPKPLKHRGRGRLHKQVGSDICTRLRTMWIIPLHPPPLACSGLSDKLSSSPLFPPCYCIVTNGTNKNVCVGE